MVNWLNFDDDGLYAVEALQQIEHAFDIKLADGEAENVRAVGEFFDILLGKMTPNDGALKCATAMSFYRLRAGLRRLGHGGPLSPGADLSFLEDGGAQANLGKLGRESGLDLPGTELTMAGCAAALAVFAGMPLIGLWLVPGLWGAWPGLALGVLAVLLVVALDPGRLPPDCRTLGGLSQRAALLNIGKLARAGARHDEQAMWRGLVEILADYGLPAAEISRDTLFRKSARKRDAVAAG